MSSSNGNAYGSANNDTDFRKTWDKAEFAKLAREKDEARRTEAKERAEAEALGKKWHRRAATPPDIKDTVARKTRINVSATVGKRMLVPANAAIGKRGRGAGFYCEACDLTFRDNMSLIEHYNSRQHLLATGETGIVRIATVLEVRERLRWLKRKRIERELIDQGGMEERVELQKRREEDIREEKRVAREEVRRKADLEKIKKEAGWEV